MTALTVKHAPAGRKASFADGGPVVPGKHVWVRTHVRCGSNPAGVRRTARHHDVMAEIPITVRGDIEQRAVDQLRRCAEAGDALAAAICADGHVGYSQPIGGVGA